MNKYVKKIASLFSAAMLIIGSSSATLATDTTSKNASSVGALLDSYKITSGTGTFTLTEKSRIYVVSDTKPSGEYLQTASLIQRQFATKYKDIGKFDFVYGDISLAEAGDIVIYLDTADTTVGADGYSLDVGESAKITAKDCDGLIYGSNMLMKCFNAADGTSLSGFSATDTPDTKQRVVMLDCGRKYLTAEWIKNFIRQISWMGYNALELHFSEDGGFRADFWDNGNTTYYQATDTDGDGYTYNPTNDFSWLCGSHVQSWVKDPYRNDPDAGKYLTTKELVEICDVANEYHIEIIPSFDSPAHMDYITWKFEQNYKSNNNYYFSYNGKDYFASATNGCINYNGKTGDTTPTWPCYTAIDIKPNTTARAFVFALYEDIADFFKEYANSTNFNIGADEVNLTACTTKWNYSDFPEYVNSLNRMLNGKGYTVRMFNDFIGTTQYSATTAFDSNIEIMYWNSPKNPTTNTTNSTDNYTASVSKFTNENRTIYNCIQTNCYYVLRIGTSGNHRDARDPNNRNWTFYHSTEDLIYNEWIPKDVSEKGDYSEKDQTIPENLLGGAYFLIWNDYASLNTEKEIWNGALDGYDKDVTYSLFNRMWSNSIKMWNSDINNSVDYSAFTTVRDTFGYFPGYTSCSASASLSATVNIEKAVAKVDKSALNSAIAIKISNSNGIYTSDSYAKYESAYNAAVTVNNNAGATQDEVNSALSALNTAKANLKKVDTSVLGKVTVNLCCGDTTFKSLTFEATAVSAPFTVYIAPQVGYTFESVEGNYKFTPLASRDGGGYLSGNTRSGSVINIKYTNTPDTSYLDTLLGEAYTERGNFTEDTWTAYKNVVDKIKSASKTNQSEIDELVEELLNATNALATDGEDEIQSVERISASASAGGQIMLRVVTSSSVSSLSVDGYDLTLCLSKVQSLGDGSVVKVWLIGFTAPSVASSGDDTEFTIKADETSETIGIKITR